MKDSKREGELAEMAFKYKALKMGFKVLQPHGESERYDCVLQSGRRFCRVQVRSTRKMSRPNMYNITACFRINHGRGAVQLLPYSEKEIDFLAAHIVPEDVWYVIPVAALRGRLALRFYAKGYRTQGPDAKYKEAWEQFIE